MKDTQETTNKPKWYKRKWVWVVGILFVLFVIGNSLPKQEQASSQDEKQTQENKEELATISHPVRDGKFEFVVKSIECGKSTVGTNPYLTKTAQGTFCLLSVSVKNVGDEPQSLFADNQYLFNDAGQKYAADSTATSYAAPEGSTWYSEINPGNSVEGVIVFDMPKDQSPTEARLHDSAFSGGVRVKLQ